MPFNRFAFTALTALLSSAHTVWATGPATLTPTPGVTLAVPAGWKSNRHHAEADHALNLQGNRATIDGCLYTASELHIGPLDSRRPSHFAARWAGAWGLPLYVWGQTGSTVVSEADFSGAGLTRIVITARGTGGEAEFVALSRAGDSGTAARLAIQALLASARGAGQHSVFPGIPSGPPQLLSVSDGGAPAKIDSVHVGNFELEVPAGWYPEEICRLHAANLVLPESYLWIVKPSAPVQSLYINWFTPANGPEFPKLQAQASLPHHGRASSVKVRYLPIDNFRKLEVESFPEAHGQVTLFYRYSYGKVVVIAHSTGNSATGPAQTDAAAVTVFRQLAGIGVADRAVAQSANGFYP